MHKINVLKIFGRLLGNTFEVCYIQYSTLRLSMVECNNNLPYCLELWAVSYNAWSHSVARENSIITKINAGSRINTATFVGYTKLFPFLPVI